MGGVKQCGKCFLRAFPLFPPFLPFPLFPRFLSISPRPCLCTCNQLLDPLKSSHRASRFTSSIKVFNQQSINPQFYPLIDNQSIRNFIQNGCAQLVKFNRAFRFSNEMVCIISCRLKPTLQLSVFYMEQCTLVYISQDLHFRM